MRHWRIGMTATVAALALAIAQPAPAQPLNERTTIKLDAPIMVPGATLEPGTYVFSLADPHATQDIIEIRKQGGDVVALAMTVPMKRQDPDGDLVMKLNPTDGGTPAMSGYFYPASIYGHQFVYPDEQAKQIADRTRTVVLSQDVKGSDMESARIFVYDPAGERKPYTPDPNLTREWNQWREGQRGQAQGQQPEQQPTRQAGAAGEPAGRAVVTAPQGEKPESTAPMIAGAGQGTRVELDDLEDNAQQYRGKTISVDGEVDEVLGPRVFKIDEGHWFNLGGEMLVVMPTHLAAMIREDDRVTVTGTVKEFVRADFEREWGFLGLADEDLEIELRARPVLVASRLVGGNDDVALMIETGQEGRTAGAAQPATDQPDRPVGTAGEARRATGDAVMNLQNLAEADDDFVGRDVKLQNVRVEKAAKGGGFWTRSGNTSILVLPVDTNQKFEAGQTLNVEGVVLTLPRHMHDHLEASGDWNEDVYIYATTIGR